MNIPLDWTLSTIADEFEAQLGKRLDAAVNRGELRTCINNRGVRWGHILSSEAIQAPLTSADIRDLRLVDGDVLMCEGGEIGRAAVWHDELPEAYFLNTLHRLRSKGGYDPHLLVAFFQRWASTGELSAIAGRATLAHLTKENLIRVRLPRPPRAEQLRLVSALGAADGLTGAIERLVAKKHAIKQGMTEQMFTSVNRESATIGGRTGKLANFLRMPATYGIVTAGDFVRHGVPMVRGGDIRGGVIAGDLPQVSHAKNIEYGRTTLEPGDVVVALVGYPGESAVVPSDLAGGNISRAVGLLRPTRDLTPEYLAHYLNSASGRREFLKRSAGSAQIVVNLIDLNRMQIYVPPHDTQVEMSSALSAVDNEINSLGKRLNKARNLKVGMMQELLTGRSRLPMELKQ